MSEESTGSRWFKIIVLVGSGFGTGFFIANAVVFGRIVNKSCNAVSRNEAQTLMWINIVMAVVFAIIFIWAIVMLLPIFKSGYHKTVDVYHKHAGHVADVYHKAGDHYHRAKQYVGDHWHKTKATIHRVSAPKHVDVESIELPASHVHVRVHRDLATALGTAAVELI